MEKEKIVLKGELEIHTKRGVVYFHLSDPQDVVRLGIPTVLRLSGIRAPIELKNGMLDIRACIDDDKAREEFEKKLKSRATKVNLPNGNILYKEE